jgi:transcriptional regulator with XRE-family HTH domain
MPQAVELPSHGRFAQALAKRMNALDITIRQLAESSGLTYEHIRKLVRGDAYPSRLALQELCRELSMNSAEMETLAIADRIEKKYGGIPSALSGNHPELSLLAPWWDLLTEEQKSSFRIQIRSVAESNQRLASQRKPAKPVSRAGSEVRRAADEDRHA